MNNSVKWIGGIVAILILVSFLGSESCESIPHSFVDLDGRQNCFIVGEQADASDIIETSQLAFACALNAF